LHLGGLVIKTLLSAAAALVLALGTSGTAFAGSKSACAPGKNKEASIAFYGQGGPEQAGSPSSESGYVETLGGAISGGFYGNTSNAGANGPEHGVNPSISPGPITVGGTFLSIGGAIQLGCGPD